MFSYYAKTQCNIDLEFLDTKSGVCSERRHIATCVLSLSFLGVNPKPG